MPAGIPVGTLAIGKPGAINAALLAASILSLSDARIRETYLAYRKDQMGKALADDDLVMP
jgi:5-(carboxyamino)imidazole ribonucleotide mutase